jgi:hypothetical protein
MWITAPPRQNCLQCTSSWTSVGRSAEWSLRITTNTPMLSPTRRPGRRSSASTGTGSTRQRRSKVSFIVAAIKQVACRQAGFDASA